MRQAEGTAKTWRHKSLNGPMLQNKPELNAGRSVPGMDATSGRARGNVSLSGPDGEIGSTGCWYDDDARGEEGDGNERGGPAGAGSGSEHRGPNDDLRA